MSKITGMRNYEIDSQTMHERCNGRNGRYLLEEYGDKSKRYYVWSIDPEDQNETEGLPEYKQMRGFITAIDLDETPRRGTKIQYDGNLWTIVDVIISQKNKYVGSIQWNLEVTKKNNKGAEL